MADDATTPQDTQAPDATSEPDVQPDRDRDRDEPTTRSVPYERFAEVNKRLKARERELQQVTSRIEDLESRDQSELERERKKAARFEREANEALDKLTRVERQQWIREAARDAKFDDPGDAVAFLDVQDIEDFEDAAQAVKDLAKAKPRLLRTDSPPVQIGQVVRNGRRVDNDDQAQGRERGQQQVPPDPQSADFLNQLTTAAKAAGWQAVPLE
jgi:DNA repair exonuclease SbcCD ATPase subunit